MYDASLMIPKKGAKSSIEIYYENEEKLAKYVMNVIENVNFEFYPELLDTLTEFYRIYIKSDEKEIVLWPLTVDDLDNRKLIITAMTNMIKSKDNDWVAQNAKGKLNGNVMKSYVTLYAAAWEAPGRELHKTPVSLERQGLLRLLPEADEISCTQEAWPLV